MKFELVFEPYPGLTSGEMSSCLLSQRRVQLTQVLSNSIEKLKLKSNDNPGENSETGISDER